MGRLLTQRHSSEYPSKTPIWAILIIIAILLASLCIQHYKHELDISRHNIEVYRDSMHIFSTKYDSAIYVNNSLILSRNELFEQLQLSKKEAKAIEKELNAKIAYYANLAGQIKYDTIHMHDTVFIEDLGINIMSEYQDQWCNISLHTVMTDSSATTDITNLQIYTPLHVGLTDSYQIFVKSDNPYVQFNDIQGAAIDKSALVQKKKHWGIGLHAGVGAQMNAHGMTFGPQLGISLSYNLIQF